MMGPLMLLMLYLLFLEPTDAMRFPHIRIGAKLDLKLSINDVSDDVPVVLQRGGCLTGSPRRCKQSRTVGIIKCQGLQPNEEADN
ncbi:hypothetical protein MAR_002601 [Mya arenaria]|uniref:Uncharacterized protein n=1 Tax=Mya arenaria TaxID=6604 RepID=A0ABY7G751_MYAAR|nr:hypothetical protein MAR_002601 [Mya arenaria]